MKSHGTTSGDHARARSAPGAIRECTPRFPWKTAGIQTTSATRIVEAFRARFDKACDAGVWKRLSNVVLEPANPFDAKARRQLRQEAHHSRDARSHGAGVGPLLQSQRNCEVNGHGEE